MILLPGLLLLSILVPRTETVACVRGTDYGNGDCVEAQCSPMDRLSAERYCRKYGGILYSNKNQFDVSMISYAMDTECGENSQVWLGITCINEKTCHNDRGQVIEILKNFTAFDEPITKPCVYMSLNNSLEKGRWFVSSCRNQIAKRPFLCWYTNDTNDPSCQPGTFFYKNRCYGLHGVQDPIATSDHCHNLGGELVSIHSENENEYIWDLAAELPSITANANFGIGLYVDMDKDLKWYDGSPVDYTNFEIPTSPPADGVYPPINSTITMDFTSKKWLADPTRGRLGQVCSWPPLSQDLQTVQVTFPNLCSSGILPIESIIYSPDYPNYTNSTNCTLTYNGVFGKPIQIVFEEQYLDVGATIEIYTDRNDPQNVITIEYNTPITNIYSSLSGYMKMVYKQPPGHLSYWRASTKTQGVRGQYPIKLGTPYICNPDTIQPLSTDTYSQFQTPNYAANGGMSRLCTIVIMPQSANNTVVVSFYDFYVGPKDIVEVIDDTTHRGFLSGTQTGIMIEGSVGRSLSFKIQKVSQGFRGIWADFTSN